MNIKLLKQALWLFAIIFGLATNVAVAQTIHFFKGTQTTDYTPQNAIKPTDILDGGDGQEIRVWVKATFPSTATQRKIKLSLGNFLELVDYGKDNENVNLYLEGNAVITDDPTSALVSDLNPSIGYQRINGQDYTDKVRKIVEINLKNISQEVLIPITVKVHRKYRFKGYATDRSVITPESAREGIEQSTPFKAELYYNGVKALNGDAFVHRMSLVNEQLRFVFAHGVSQITNMNDYESPVTVSVYGRHQGYEPISLLEKLEFDIILPLGIDIKTIQRDINVFDYQSETIPQGNKKYSFRLKKPVFVINNIAITPVFKIVDPSVVQGETQKDFDITFKYNKLNIRNYGENSPVSINQYLNAQNERILPLRYLYVDPAQESFSFFQGLIGQEYSPNENSVNEVNSVPLKQILSLTNNNDYYPAVTFFPTSDYYIRNLGGSATEEKEIKYVFHSNPYIDVKGFRVLQKHPGYPTPYVKTKSKQDPYWRTTNLPSGLSVEHMVTIKDIGYQDDDVITEAIIPVGSFAPQQSMGRIISNRQLDVVGVFKQAEITNDVVVPVADVFIRTLDYNELSPAPDSKNTKVITLKTKLRKYNEQTGDPAKSSLRIDFKSNENPSIVQPNEAVSIKYEVTSASSDDRYYVNYNNSLTQVEKIALVYPKEINVTSITLTNAKEQPITVPPMEVILDGANKKYIIDLSSAPVLDRTLGVYATPTPGVDNNDLKTVGKITVSVNVKNNVLQETTLQVNKSIFVETSTFERYLNNLTVRNDDYDIDGDGLTTTDLNVFTTNPTTSGPQTILFNLGYRVDLNVEAKLKSESAYNPVVEGEKYLVKDKNAELNIKYRVKNPTGIELGPLELYLPIPKKGQNWGANFQTEPFKFDLRLEETMQGQGTFNDNFDVEYATVPPAEITGTLDVAALSTKSFGAYTNTANLIRIKSKTGKKIPENTTYDIVGSFKVYDVTDSQDGQQISWSSYYKVGMGNFGSPEFSTVPFTVQLSLGTIKVQLFTDTNMDGDKASTEQNLSKSGIQIEIYDSNKKVANGTTNAQGIYIATGLVSGKQYTVKVKNPTPTTQRLTTGTVNAAFTESQITMTARINEAEALLNVGLTIQKITNTFKVDTAKGKFNTGTATDTSRNIQGFFSDKMTAAPDVVGVNSFNFLGWLKNGSGAPIPTNDIKASTFGAEATEYVAKFGTSLANEYGNTQAIKPIVKTQPIAIGSATPQAGDFIDKTVLPSDTQYTWKDNNAPITCPTKGNTLGFQKKIVEVKFSDNSKKEVEVVVPVEQRPDLFGSTGVVYEVCAGKSMPMLTTGDEPAGNAGGFTYSWEVKKPGATNWASTGDTTSKMTPTIQTKVGTYKYRKVSKKGGCTITSEEITVNVKSCYGASINGVGTRR